MPYITNGVGFQKTDTSYEAAIVAAQSAETIREAVLVLLKASPAPLTTEQIVTALGRPYRSVQPRLSELRNLKLVFDSGKRNPSEFGVDIIRWTTVKPVTDGVAA